MIRYETMKKLYLILPILAMLALSTGCANWGATQSFDAGRAGVTGLDAVVGLTCDDRDPGQLKPEVEHKCRKYEAASKSLKDAIDLTQASWSDIAPLLGVDPESFKVAKKPDAGQEEDEAGTE